MNAPPPPASPETASPAASAPPVPRDAASLILLDASAGPLKVLMGQRGTGARFAPSQFVFPGGAVDTEDYEAEAGRPFAEHTTRRLHRAHAPGLAHALGIACARELEEETGLTLGAPPDLSGLSFLCRAITPPTRPIRFDARFFVGERRAVAGEIAGSGELSQLDWYDIEAVLKLDLPHATRAVLGQLEIWLALAPEARQAAPVPTLRERVWVSE